MAVTIDVTVGGASANSYATLAEADSYITGRLNASTWESDASDDTKNRALVEAARDVDALMYAGRHASETQSLQWPRDWVTNPDSPSKDFYENTLIPQRVKDAQMELAFQYVKAGTTDISERDKKLDLHADEVVDAIRTVYEPAHSRPHGLERFPRVWMLLSPLLDRQPGLIPVIRG